MSDAPARPRGWRLRLLASERFQDWASRFPLTQRRAAAEGRALFDLVAGFAYSQALLALVELDILERLSDGPRPPADLADAADLPVARMAMLLQAGAALGLLKRRRDGRFALAERGAELLGVPGLRALIRHHRAFYRDLEDPVALLRGTSETELADIWPYVLAGGGDLDPETVATYSHLMAESQRIVAAETLRRVSLDGVSHLMDVGGGTGAFLAAVAEAYPTLDLTLFDLPQVVARATAVPRMTVAGGNFRDDPLPPGADAISLVRVLYDHDDETVRALLSRVHDALPPSGRVIVSEPMSGGIRPEPAGDVYFALYTMAMRTGQTRSAARIGRLLREAGFDRIRAHPTRRPFVTSVVTAERA